jgi:hypothetical protein
MDGCVATRGPAGPHAEKGRMIYVADVNVAAGNKRALHLGVAAETQIGIACHQHFLIDGAVRIVADHASFTQRVVPEDKRPRLIPMALGATLILPRHGQPAGWFHDVQPVRVVALDAVHAAFQDLVVLGKMELSLNVQMALKTSRRVTARIDDESFAAAQAGRGHVFAAGPVTGFASALAGHRRVLSMYPCVRAGWESSHNVRVTIHARLVPDEMSARDLRRRHDPGRERGTRDDQQCG